MQSDEDYAKELKKQIGNGQISIDLISLQSDTHMRVHFREFKSYNAVVENFKKYDIVIVHINGIVSRLLEDALSISGVIVIPYTIKTKKEDDEKQKKHLNVKHGEKLFAWIYLHWNILFENSKEIYEKIQSKREGSCEII